MLSAVTLTLHLFLTLSYFSTLPLPPALPPTSTPYPPLPGHHGRMNYKDNEPYMYAAFFYIDLLTDFAALCLTNFIDRRYIHSWLVFCNQLVNCCPHADSVWLWGGGGC
jgi:hypothetical protein